MEGGQEDQVQRILSLIKTFPIVVMWPRLDQNFYHWCDQNLIKIWSRFDQNLIKPFSIGAIKVTRNQNAKERFKKEKNLTNVSFGTYVYAGNGEMLGFFFFSKQQFE